MEQIQENEQWQLNGNCEDGAFLGVSPADVTRLFRDELTWSENATFIVVRK